MLRKFKYLKPETLELAIEYLAEEGENAALLSGGTDLVVQIRAKMINAETVIDVRELPELRTISQNQEEVIIGGAVTFSELIESDIIRDYFPALRQAALKVGSPQIRNLGTIAGNVQTASPAGDVLVALFGEEAEVKLVSKNGERTVLIQNFITGPKKTNKKPDELITGFKLKKKSWDYEEFFKIGRRNALAISVLNGVIKLDFDENNNVSDALIVLGAVAPTPVRIKAAEELKGQSYTEELGKELQDIVKKSISPISDIRAGKEYREYMAAVKCNRIISGAFERRNG